MSELETMEPQTESSRGRIKTPEELSKEPAPLSAEEPPSEVDADKLLEADSKFELVDREEADEEKINFNPPEQEGTTDGEKNRNQSRDETKFDEQVKSLIGKLGAKTFSEREIAQNDLIKIGAPALKHLEGATGDPDYEIKTRAKTAVGKIRENQANPEGNGDINSIEKAPSELDKKVTDLINKMGDDDFHKRERAQVDLVEIGTPAFKHLEKAQDNPDLEIRIRARHAMHQIVNNPPVGGEKSLRAYEKGLGQVGKNGSLSREEHNQYENLIDELDHCEMSDRELKARKNIAHGKGYNFETPVSEQIKGLKEIEQLSAMGNVPPGAQARLDYADLLNKSGDKARAAELIGEAVKKYPGIALQPSFLVRATESGIINDSAFRKTVDDATGEKDVIKNKIENPDFDPQAEKIFRTMDHLTHETSRAGTNPRLEKDWQTYLKDLDNKMENNPEMKGFLSSQKLEAQKRLIEGFTINGETEKASAMMARMLNEDPGLADWAWLHRTAELNESDKHPEFNRTMREVNKKRNFGAPLVE